MNRYVNTLHGVFVIVSSIWQIKEARHSGLLFIIFNLI
jgi:hypothetical protein